MSNQDIESEEGGMMDEGSKQWIDNASYEQLLRRWRHALAGGDPIFQGDTGDYYAKVMQKRKNELLPAEEAETLSLLRKVQKIRDQAMTQERARLVNLIHTVRQPVGTLLENIPHSPTKGNLSDEYWHESCILHGKARMADAILRAIQELDDG